MDIFVNPELEGGLKSKDLSTNAKLMDALARAMSGMGSDREFLQGHA